MQERPRKPSPSESPVAESPDVTVRCTVHRVGSHEIRQLQQGDVSIFVPSGVCSPGFVEILERALKRAGVDVGLDLRGMRALRPTILPVLKRLHRDFEAAGRVFLLYDPPARLVDYCELDGSLAEFHIYRSQEGLMAAPAPVTPGGSAGREIATVAQRIIRFERDLGRADELESTLDHARRLSLRKLSKPLPEFHPFQFSTAYLPHDKVGGDFFFVIPLDADHAGVAIGDVSGHGLDAALLMGVARKVLEIRALEGTRTNPPEVVAQVNRDLFSELDRFTFITSVYGVLERGTGRFAFARAGHNYPLLIAPQRREATLVNTPGIALGIDPGTVFEANLGAGQVAIAPGNTLLLYTDGLVEAEHPTRGQFGVDRLLETCREVEPSASAEEVRERIVGEVKKFLDGEPLADDVTLICIQHEG